jgi:hypothetical protein
VVDVVVVVFGFVVVCVVVVTGGVARVVVDFTVAVVVVTGATGATGAVVVTTGEAVVTGAAAAVVVGALWWTAGFLRWAFLWCTARLCGAAAADDAVLDVVEVLAVREVVVPPELPQPATTTLTAITVSHTAFIRPTPLVALGPVPKANDG